MPKKLMKVVPQIILIFTFLILSTTASAISNREMHEALRGADSLMGKISGIKGSVRHFEGIGRNVNEPKQEFYFVVRGQATSYGEVELYKQVTTLENLGANILLKHYTRKVPAKLMDIIANHSSVKEDISDMEKEGDYRAKFTKLKDAFYVQVYFPESELDGELDDFFRDLNGFHGTLEAAINNVVYDYKELIEDEDYKFIGDFVQAEIQGQKVKFPGEQIFFDIIAQPLDPGDQIGKNHWSYMAADGFKVDAKLTGSGFESGIYFELFSTLTEAKRKEFVKALTIKAKKDIPEGYSGVVVSIEKGSPDMVRVAFIYKFQGREGEDIRKHFDSYLEVDQEIHKKLNYLANLYNSGNKPTYNLQEFVKLVAEDDLEIKDSISKKGFQGFWEFSISDVDFTFANYGDRMLLSSSLSLSDDWTLKEIEDGNKSFKASIKPADYLNADKFEVTRYNNDPYEIWVRAEFIYKNWSTKQLVQLYEKFMIGKGAGRKLIIKLRAAQGAGPLDPIK